MGYADGLIQMLICKIVVLDLIGKVTLEALGRLGVFQ